MASGQRKSVNGRVNRLYHRALDLSLRVDSTATLNSGVPGGAPADDVAAELSSAVKMMKSEAFVPATGSVNYPALRSSDSYQRYRACSARLCDFDLDTLTGRQEKLAFWINLYNALVVDGIISYGLASVHDDLGFFRRVAYTIGGERYSADDIEHGVLRGNRRHFHPAIWLPQFGRDDSRLARSVLPADPRIHFALVCGTRSCPPFDSYSAENLDAQLDAAASSFINGGAVALDTAGGVVCVSPIFKWYRRDFDEAGGAVEMMLRYLDDGPVKRALRAGTGRIHYQDWDWSLNAA